VLGTELERIGTARSIDDVLRAELEPEALQQFICGWRAAPGGLLVAATDQLRREVVKAGHTVPPVRVPRKRSLPSYGVYLYMGVEELAQYAFTVGEVIGAIRNQVTARRPGGPIIPGVCQLEQ
jgi:hypothetical protein